LFADDTNLLIFGTELVSIGKKMNIDLKVLVNWLNAKKIASCCFFYLDPIDENFKIKIMVRGLPWLLVLL